MNGIKILTGDCREVLKTLADNSVHCCVTSPPYWGLRDYGTARWDGGDAKCEHEASERYYTEQTAAQSSGDAFSEAGASNAERLRKGRWRESGHCVKCGAVKVDGQIGLEQTPDEYVAEMVEVFREVRRVLREDGTCWLNLGDSYSTQPPGNKTPCGFSQTRPSRVSGNGDQETVKTGRGLVPNLKPKDLIGIPWRVALALQADGWWLRQDIIWHKPAPMPESVTDRCTKAHEYIFLLTKSSRYYFDSVAIAEAATNRPCGNTMPTKASRTGDEKYRTTASLHLIEAAETRNKRSVWTVNTCAYKGAHFATFPPDLIRPCILAGTSEEGVCADCGAPYARITERQQLKRERPNEYTKRSGDDGTGNSCANTVAGVDVKTTGWQPSCKCNAVISRPIVLDPFGGSGTTAQVARECGCEAILIELNPEYVKLAKKRNKQEVLL